LIASWIAWQKINGYKLDNNYDYNSPYPRATVYELYHQLERELLILAAITFIAAFWLAFLFTYIRSKKTGVPIWGFVARKVMINVAIPMLAGGLVMWRMTEFGLYGFIAPSCLIFYGLGLINSSKFTYPEIRYLGYGQLVLGVIALWMMGNGLLFWALGFGLLHIVYGFVMWWKHERTVDTQV
jgi:hypothetical protein